MPKAMAERVNNMEVTLQKVVSAQETLATEVTKSSAKIDKLVEFVSEQKAIQVKISHIEHRLEQAEKSRWWISITVIGAVVAAILRDILYN